jgi:hypothetical protein
MARCSRGTGGPHQHLVHGEDRNHDDERVVELTHNDGGHALEVGHGFTLNYGIDAAHANVDPLYDKI